jgi:hypothetical protein
MWGATRQGPPALHIGCADRARAACSRLQMVGQRRHGLQSNRALIKRTSGSAGAGTQPERHKHMAGRTCWRLQTRGPHVCLITAAEWSSGTVRRWFDARLRHHNQAPWRRGAHLHVVSAWHVAQWRQPVRRRLVELWLASIAAAAVMQRGCRPSADIIVRLLWGDKYRYSGRKPHGLVRAERHIGFRPF